MSKIEHNKNIKKGAILNAAKGIFLAEGYQLTSMDKIALQAKMTKQTLYRYFPSKLDLFHATLQEMGGSIDQDFVDKLKIADPKQALVAFAVAFIEFHLSDQHIATFRLLVAEGAKSPEIIKSFHSVGPESLEESLEDTLSVFFTERLQIKVAESDIELWLAMLISLRSSVLMGMPIPSSKALELHVKQSCDFLLRALR